MIIGIDASRNRSGGAVAHIIGILGNFDPTVLGVEKVHLWGYEELLDQIPDYDWLMKHCPEVCSQNIVKQLIWQRVSLPKEAQRLKCNLMFNTDAGTVCPFKPAVTLSQDMLSFEPGEMARYKFSKAWLRLFLIKYFQKWSLNKADGVIFLTEYARQMISQVASKIMDSVVVNHGVHDAFRGLCKEIDIRKTASNLVYISNAAPYKHQWKVVEAVAEIRKKFPDVTLTLIGGGSGKAQERLEKAIARHDPKGDFIVVKPFVPNAELPKELQKADVFVFASSCENMPITLIEGMSSGLPIASSDRGPMPEVLKDAGVYFDPENSATIIDALEKLLKSPELRIEKSILAQGISANYNWKKCSEETWDYLVKHAKKTA